MVTIKNYVQPNTLEEAWTLNQKKSNKIIAGMLWTKMTEGNVQTAIDLSALGLDKIEEDEHSFSIYAMTTLSTLEHHKSLNAYCNNAVRDAVKDIVGVQFRNLATIGGSIYGRYGFSDLLTVFLGLDADVELYKEGIVSLREYAARPYDRDLLVRLIVKKNLKATCFQCMRNTKTDFSVLNTCVSLSTDGKAFAVVGARPGKAVVIEDDKNILATLSPATFEQFAEYVAEHTQFESNIRASAEYRKTLCKVLVRRCLENLGG